MAKRREKIDVARDLLYNIQQYSKAIHSVENVEEMTDEDVSLRVETISNLADRLDDLYNELHSAS